VKKGKGGGYGGTEVRGRREKTLAMESAVEREIVQLRGKTIGGKPMHEIKSGGGKERGER